MVDSSIQERVNDVNRRKLLAMMGGAGAGSLAGCLGDDDDDDPGDDSDGETELGEEVPTLRVAYMSNLGGKSDILENIIAVTAESLGELGLEVDPQPMEIGTIVDHMLEDSRDYEFALWGFGNVETALDPHDPTNRFRIDQAGARGGLNPGQYASCEFSNPGVSQAQATSEDERLELVQEAHTIMNDDRMGIGISNTIEFGLGRIDQVNWDGLGDYGYSNWNYHLFIHSEPTNDENQIISGMTRDGLETTNYIVFPSLTGFTPFSKLLHSPLVVYDEHFELRTELAQDYQVEDNATSFIFELHDATFHNGETVTAEDVKFTFEYVQSLVGQADQIEDIPYESIEVIDEQTVQMNTEEPYLPLVQSLAPICGIMHKETWEAAGAPDEVAEPDEIPGSGPFQLRSFDRGTRVAFDPYEDHVLYDVDHNLVFSGIDDIASGFSLLEQGDVHLLSGDRMSPEFWSRGQEDYPDEIDGSITDGFMSYNLNACWPKAPTKFYEFRDAVSKALDRERINDIAFHGYGTPKLDCHWLGHNHPFAPDEDTLDLATTDPTGDIDAAREVLSDAGWGWDDDGNLRYPADADLEPLWEEGGSPDPEDHECLDADGDLVL